MSWLDTLLSRPTRTPKSAYLAWATVLVAFAVVGLALVVERLTGSRIVLLIALVVGPVCWLVVGGTIVLHFVRSLTGAYRNLPERPLRDQVW